MDNCPCGTINNENDEICTNCGYELNEKSLSNYSKSIEYFSKFNTDWSNYALGTSYININDYQNAIKYYRLAADNGHIEAQYWLAYYYDEIFNDFENAKKYYHLAADNGNKCGQFDLAIIYRDIEHDKINAKKYFKMAAEQGHKGAETALEELENPLLRIVIEL